MHRNTVYNIMTKLNIAEFKSKKWNILGTKKQNKPRKPKAKSQTEIEFDIGIGAEAKHFFVHWNNILGLKELWKLRWGLCLWETSWKFAICIKPGSRKVGCPTKKQELENLYWPV